MGKTTGFMEWERRGKRRLPVEERLGNYRELYTERSAEESAAQGGRCMDCGVPVCQQGCPLGNMIPDWNDYVFRGNWQRAYERLEATNNFPEFTGRLCPAPCEGACVLGINDDPVTIEHIEWEIIEKAFGEGWVSVRAPQERSGKKIAVVGSGPAGLAAAEQLNLAGHTVVVYEAADEIGGLLRYGIPDFKLEKSVIDRRLELMREASIEFETSTPVGSSPSWSDLDEQYDAVVLAIGAEKARDLEVPGRELRGVCLAMDYLERQNRLVAGKSDSSPALDARGKKVVILGGGDTGSDCLGTALRQGASSVHQIELLPAPPKSRAGDNPWPQWPMVFRTSSSHEEGGERLFGAMTTEFIEDSGRVAGLTLVDIEGFEGGKPVMVPGSERRLDADLVILAVGFTGPVTESLVDQLQVDLDGRGNIARADGFATNKPGLFVAGDATRGASLIVWAIADGRECARQVDLYLRQSEVPALPTKGRDCPYGGR